MLKTILKIILLTTLLMMTRLTSAAILVGETLPALQINDIGECVLRGEEASFQPWSSKQMQGKVQLFQHVAARAGTIPIHQDFIEGIAKKFQSEQNFSLTIVVNADDSLLGTGVLVPMEIRKDKQKNPGRTLVVDTQGAGRSYWMLQEKSSALLVLDSTGRVVFFKEGALTGNEKQTIETLIKKLLTVEQKQTIP